MGGQKMSHLVAYLVVGMLLVLVSGKNSFAAEVILKMTDRKGDQSRFTGRGDVAPAATDLVTFLNGKTYAGCVEYSEVTPGMLLAPKVVVDTDVANNDCDYKAVIAYKDFTVPANPKVRKLVIPAPDTSTANGVCVVIGEESQFIPAIPPDGATGKGGNTIITEWETALGVAAGTFKFISGGFIKLRG
jgi:hypothetical protein